MRPFSRVRATVPSTPQGVSLVFLKRVLFKRRKTPTWRPRATSIPLPIHRLRCFPTVTTRRSSLARPSRDSHSRDSQTRESHSRESRSRASFKALFNLGAFSSRASLSRHNSSLEFRQVNFKPEFRQVNSKPEFRRVSFRPVFCRGNSRQPFRSRGSSRPWRNSREQSFRSRLLLQTIPVKRHSRSFPAVSCRASIPSLRAIRPIPACR
jgi:hypothetical protein